MSAQYFSKTISTTTALLSMLKSFSHAKLFHVYLRQSDTSKADVDRFAMAPDIDFADTFGGGACWEQVGCIRSD